MANKGTACKMRMKYIIRIFLFIALLMVISENYLLNHSFLEMPGKPESFQAASDDPGWLQGWTNSPGSTVISTDDPAVIETLDDEGKRLTPLVDTPKARAAFLGCSYTYGMGVRDNDTFIWRIAEQLPYVQCDNYAVPGYGTHQCCTWLAHLNYERQNGKEKYHYDKFFYAFIGDHLNRNLEFRFNRTKSGNIVVLPRAEENNGQTIYYGLETLYWPGCDKFAIIVFFRNLYANYLLFENRYLSHENFLNNDKDLEEDQKNLFKMILSDMLKISKNYGAELYVLYLDCNADGIIEDSDLKRNGLHTVDMVYDNIGSYKSRIRSLPNRHPNAEVHKYWADSFVRQMKDKF